MIDFWNMKYKKGGVYRTTDRGIDPTPYLETKSGHRVSIGGLVFIYILGFLLIVWALA